MRRNSARYRGLVCRAAGLAALGLAPSAWAANLLVNPGFESPADTTDSESTICTGWTFYANAERAIFEAHTGRWSNWQRDFEPAGGVTQVVSNIVAGDIYTLSAYQYFETNFNTTGETVDFELTWENSSGATVGTPNILDIAANTSTPVPTGVWTQYTLSSATDSNGNPVIAPAGATQVQVSFDYRGPGSSGPQLSSYVDDADLEGAGIPPTIATWSLTTSGDWNIAGDWSTGNVPNGVGQEADLFGAITANRNVYSDIPITVGIINFNSPFTYVVDGAGSLTMQASTGAATVIVQQGTQEINLPTTLASNTVFNVSGGSTLIIGDPLTVDAGKSLTTIGTGTVTYDSIVTLQTGATLALTNSTHAAGLNLQGSSAATVVAHSGTSPVALELDTLAIGGSANNWTSKLDVANNDLILNNGNLATTTNQIKQGLAGSAGIVSSSALASTSHLTTLGVIQNDNGSGSPLYATFGGMSGLTNTAVLVKYTYFGDTNLDGKVDGSDYSRIDSSFLAEQTSHASVTGWSNGDFNYDGVINGSDYTLIDNAYNRQGAQLSAGISSPDAVATAQIAVAGSAVPEPASLGLIGLGAAAMLCQRRRVRPTSR